MDAELADVDEHLSLHGTRAAKYAASSQGNFAIYQNHLISSA